MFKPRSALEHQCERRADVPVGTGSSLPVESCQTGRPSSGRLCRASGRSDRASHHAGYQSLSGARKRSRYGCKIGGTAYTAAVDISVRCLNAAQIKNLLGVLATRGFAGWYRRNGLDEWTGPPHVHAIWTGSPLKPYCGSRWRAGCQEVTGWGRPALSILATFGRNEGESPKLVQGFELITPTSSSQLRP